MRRLARATPILVPLILALGAAGFAASAQGDDTPAPHREAATTPADPPILGVIDALGIIDSAERYATMYWSQVAQYATAVNLAAWVAAHQPAPRARSSSSSVVSTGGRSSVPHTDAWWHGVAQCEQGGRNDPHFGYFSFMDGSQGGRPWDEQVAAGNALLQRAGREVGPWAASCVAAGYRASPGG